MKKILKGQPSPHIMIVDTNILWNKDKGPPVNPDFDTFWKEHKSLVKLELVIPEVVRGEILFQQTSSALKALDKVSDNIKEISSITASTHRHRLTKETIEKQIAAKLDKWIKSKRASIAKIPLTSIDWMKLCDNAIWRRPPFTLDPKNPDTEKGFRDALILETVLDLARRESRQVNIVFVCNDFLLRTTAENRLSADNRCLFYEKLPDFSSYIRLTKEKLTKEFITTILNRAKEKFYSPGDSTCLFYRDKLKDKIALDYRDKFENPEDSAPSLLSLMGKDKSWEPSDNGCWWFYNPEFEKFIGDHEYHWKSTLLFVRGYKRFFTVHFTPSDLLLEPTEKVLFLRFVVFWKADVKTDGRFHNVTLERIEHLEKTFRIPTDEEVRTFQLQKTTP